jgi:hypothetical protein
MASNETDPPRDSALQRAEAAGDAVAEALERYLDRLVTASGTARTELDANLRAAGRLMARHTHRQLAANLGLMQGLMAARGIPAMLQLQQDFLRRQAEWAIRDWERAGAQALDLLDEARRTARGSGPPDVPGRGATQSDVPGPALLSPEADPEAGRVD